MFKKLILATLITGSLMAAPAFAQTAPSPTPSLSKSSNAKCLRDPGSKMCTNRMMHHRHKHHTMMHKKMMHKM